MIHWQLKIDHSGNIHTKKLEYAINQDFYLLFFVFLAALGLHCYVRAFSSCGERGLLFVVVCVLLIVVASLGVEHGL